MVSPSEQALRMHEEIENLRGILQKFSTESSFLVEQNKEIKYMYSELKLKFYKIYVTLFNQMNFHVAKRISQLIRIYLPRRAVRSELLPAGPAIGEWVQHQEQELHLKRWKLQQLPDCADEVPE